MSIKISHEAPVPYMKQVRSLIDYDYMLPHLMDESEEYKDYFIESKAMGRYIVMDNSLHELGKPYDSDRLLHWMNYIKPDEFIVPDFWQDKNQTLVSAKEWIGFNYPEGVTPVAVVQANDRGEAIECYQTLKDLGYKKIAFSYGADWYSDLGEGSNKFLKKAQGRYNLIQEMYQKGIILSTDRVHLLGCNVPQEYSFYKNMPFIESLDTSNPVIHGLAGKKYESFGLTEKLPYKVDKFNGDSKNWDLAIHNIKKFKDFLPN